MKTTTYSVTVTGTRSDDDNGSSTTFETIGNFETLLDAETEFIEFEDDIEQGYMLRVELREDDDVIKERIIKGEDISGKLIVRYNHVTYLGYAHRFHSAEIAKKGSTTSDLNGTPIHLSDTEEVVFEDVKDFVKNGKCFKFTTSHEDWCDEIAAELRLTNQEQIEAGMDWVELEEVEE